MLNNFPVDLLRDAAGFLIGVYVNPFETVDKSDIRHSISVLERVLKVKAATDSLQKFRQCDLLVYPRGLSRYKTFMEKDLDPIFELGYKEAWKMLREASDNLPIPGET